MKISMASEHAGFELRQAVTARLKAAGLVVDRRRERRAKGIKDGR